MPINTLAPTFAVILLSSALLPASPRPPFEFRDGDRVVLLGDTLIEREQLNGFLEHRLTVQFPERKVTFRNLGWSADTPAGVSRASFDFDKPGKAFDRLKEQIAAVQPSVVILGYGQACSLEDPAVTPGETENPDSAAARGLDQFKTELTRLMDSIQRVSSNSHVRFILLSPVRHEDLGAPLPKPNAHNERLALYDQALRELAAARDCEFISLYDLPDDGRGANPRQPLTENGIHLSPFGYAQAAQAVARGLGWQPDQWRVAIAADGKITESLGARVSALSRTTYDLRFTLSEQQVISPPLLDASGNLVSGIHSGGRLKIAHLPTGRYELKVDGVPVATATQRQWRRGVAINHGPQIDRSQALRETIVKKNELFFDRWRPQNETYLLGFRKHEQGQNAKEIPMFDPLIAEQENKIAALRVPVKHTFELAPVEAEAAVPAAKPAAKTPLRPVTPSPVPDFEVAPGFEVNLFAESPLLAKPTQMNFDPQGRLWVASSAVYPQIQPGQPAEDKILVLEDTNGDGFAEKSTVFAEGLLIPSGVMPGDGGVYVGQSTELLHFRDTDGDGKSDQRRVVLSGLGTEDTHHMVHTLRWGPDGQLYFNQSIYIHSHIETPHGVQRLNSGGVWHLRPPTLELGVFVLGFCNPWGHDFDQFGQSFFTDGAGYQGLSYGLPGATFFTYASMRRELKSISPGNFPKFAGLEIIRSTQFPPDWQGNAITCDFRAHRVVRFGIEESGAGFAARELSDLLRTTNVTFRPIDVKLGPDGALYIADWSNPIIQHGEVDFRDPRRDHEHGRIWRVTARGRPLVERPSLVNASNQQLFDQLLSPNAYNQRQASRVLTERGPTIRKDLAKWLKLQTSDLALLQALWIYQAIDVPEPGLLARTLNARDGRIRAAATRVAGAWQARLKNPLDLLALRLEDAHPRVRLEAVRALAEIPSTRSTQLVLDALNRPMDTFMEYAVWLSINDLANPWLAAVRSGEWRTAGREKQLEFALKAIEPAYAGIVLGQVLRNKPLARDGSGPWLELIGTAGDQALLRRVFDQALTNGFDGTTTTRALEALAVAARQRSLRPSGDLAALAPLLDDRRDDVREQAVRLAGAWKLKMFVPKLIAVADGTSPSPAAFEALRELGGDAVIAGLLALAGPDRPPARRQQAVLTLAALDLDKASPLAVSLLTGMTNEPDARKFWRSLLGIKDAGPALARALPKTGLPPEMARAGLRAAREGGRSEPDLVWALTRGADLEGEAQTLSAVELQQLAERVPAEGDPARGEKIFRRKDLSCVTCHAIGGAGGKVGPDLTSIGASAQVDYLIESILYPNRKIKEGYHSVIVETKDGLEYSGVLVTENSETLVLRDATGKETSIAKNDLQNRQTGNSLMPTGLVDALNPAERLDLYRFLAELGKPGPYDASRANVARSWKLLPATIELAQFGDDKALDVKLSDTRWTPANALVDGRLLKEELAVPVKASPTRGIESLYVAAQFQVAKAGTITFKLTGADAAPLWIDGQPVASRMEPSADLSAGPHTVVLKLDCKHFPEALRLESADAAFVGF